MTTPSIISEVLLEWFGFPNETTYCQLATSNKLQPYVRTMRLYEMRKEGSLIFITRTTSDKWKTLQENPNVAICFFKPQQGQILVKGEIILKTYKEDAIAAGFYWQLLTDYWQNYYKSFDETKNFPIPLSFGIVEVEPIQWEILKICEEDYRKSTRKQFKLTSNAWLERDLDPE